MTGAEKRLGYAPRETIKRKVNIHKMINLD
jgi:hypothetical protein